MMLGNLEGLVAAALSGAICGWIISALRRKPPKARAMLALYGGACAAAVIYILKSFGWLATADATSEMILSVVIGSAAAIVCVVTYGRPQAATTISARMQPEVVVDEYVQRREALAAISTPPWRTEDLRQKKALIKIALVQMIRAEEDTEKRNFLSELFVGLSDFVLEPNRSETSESGKPSSTPGTRWLSEPDQLADELRDELQKALAPGSGTSGSDKGPV